MSKPWQPYAQHILDTIAKISPALSDDHPVINVIQRHFEGLLQTLEAAQFSQ